MKRTIYIKSVLSLFIIGLLTGAAIILAQESPKNNQKMEEKNFDTTAQSQNKVSLEVKSIQRINLEVEDMGADGKTFYKKKPKVGIVFQAQNFVIDPAGNMQFSIIIGDKAFFASGSGDNIYVEMSQEDFDNLKDNSYISLVFGLSPGDAEDKLKKTYKNGEPQEIANLECCRLNKKLISNLPTVERTNIPSRESKKP